MPFTGKWAYNIQVAPPYTDANSSHPSVHRTYWGDTGWAVDLYAGAGTPVILTASSAQGAVSFSLNAFHDTCSSVGANVAGRGVALNVLVNGITAGLVVFEHLDNISGGPYTNGMKLGTVTGEPLSTSCYGARHVHVEMKNSASGTYSCWVDHGQPGGTLSQGTPLGHIGSPNGARRQSCGTLPITSGDVQFAVATQGGSLWHTVRYGGGSWQPRGDLRAKLGLPASVIGVAQARDSSGSVQYVLATAGGGLWHTIRKPDGSWQPKGDLKAKLGIPDATIAVAAARDAGGGIQFALATATGALWHTIRRPDGSWQPKGDLRWKLGLTTSSVAITAATSGSNTEYVLATQGGGVWHTIRRSDGSWQTKGDLRAKLGLTSSVISVAGAKDGSGSVQYVLGTAAGSLWHTIRRPDGSWQPRGDLRAALGLASTSVAVAASSDSSGGVQYAVGTAAGGLWHTIRRPAGSWQAKGDLRAVLGLASVVTDLGSG